MKVMEKITPTKMPDDLPGRFTSTRPTSKAP